MTSAKPPLAELRAQCRALCAIAGPGHFLRRSGSDDFCLCPIFHAMARPKSGGGPGRFGPGWFLCAMRPGSCCFWTRPWSAMGLLGQLPLTRRPFRGRGPPPGLCPVLVAASPSGAFGAPAFGPLRRVLKLTGASLPAPMPRPWPLHQEAALACGSAGRPMGLGRKGGVAEGQP